MKKIKNIFIIFGLFFGFAPHVHATPGAAVTFSKTSSVSTSNGGFMQVGNCIPRTSYKKKDDEYLYASSLPGSGIGYEADNGDCAQPTWVCIAGPSSSDEDSGYNSCWQSTETGVLQFIGEAGTDDEWHKTITIPDCPTGGENKWTKKSTDQKKTPVFVLTDNTVFTSSAPYVLRSIVGNTNILQTLNVQCVAYVCQVDNKYYYGCPDGTCKENCPGEKNDPENPDNPGDNPTVKHRNSVQPYLDVLNNCLIQ